MSKQQVLALYPEGSYDIVPNDGMRKVVSAPSAAAARTRRSAAARFVALSPVELSCTAAARKIFRGSRLAD